MNSLEDAGYVNYWKILDAQDFGIPQSRQRVFIVSIRKDIDTGIFEFPKQFELEENLKDILEHGVDAKYYVSPEKAAILAPQLKDKTVSNTVRRGGRMSTDRHSWDLVAVSE